MITERPGTVVKGLHIQRSHNECAALSLRGNHRSAINCLANSGRPSAMFSTHLPLASSHLSCSVSSRCFCIHNKVHRPCLLTRLSQPDRI